jgi:hypothetical protein
MALLIVGLGTVQACRSNRYVVTPWCCCQQFSISRFCDRPTNDVDASADSESDRTTDDAVALHDAR